MATKIEWETLKGHAGLQFRRFGNELSFRFRQRQYAIDFLGIISQEAAIRVAAELRENRATGAGPQTWKEMQDIKTQQAQTAAIIETRERKRIIAEDRFAQENTVATFWDRVYWPERSAYGNQTNNKSLLCSFNRWIRPILGDIPLQELTAEDIKKMTDGVQAAGMKPRTVDVAYKILQAEWNRAVTYLSNKNKIYLPPFPGKEIKKKLPKQNNQKICWLEKGEAFLLIQTLYNWRQCCEKQGIFLKGPDTKEAYGMSVLSLFSGMRLGDICKLTWRDVQTAYSHAKNPKGGQAYGIHLDVPMVAPMLEERRRMFPHARPEETVFKNTIGEPWKAAPDDYEDAVEELGLNYTPRRINDPLERIDFHSLRHTFASWLSMAGANLQTIMLLMGHQSINLTLRYARLNPAYTRQPVADLAGGFARQHGLLSDGDFVYAEKLPVSHEMKTDIFMLEE